MSFRRAGTGLCPSAPEDWGRLTLTFADGETFSTYHSSYNSSLTDYGDRDGWYTSGRTGGLLYFSRSQGWDGRDYQPVTLQSWTREEPFRGRAEVINNDGNFLRFVPDDAIFEDKGEYEAYSGILRSSSASPALWWRDTYHYLLTHALRDIICDNSLAARSDLAKALDLVLGEDLESINHITDYPDSNDWEREAVLRLYNAGILTGTDSTGSFSPDGFLARAEMAAMAARILRPALRVEFSPEEPAYQSYTLTPMGSFSLSASNVISSHLLKLQQRLLRSDGTVLELPQGASVSRYGLTDPEPYPLLVLSREDVTMPGGYIYGLMDPLTGEMVLPFGPYAKCTPVEDGQMFITKIRPWDQTEWTPTLLWDRTGKLIRELPDRMDTEIPWESLGSGLAPTYDPASELWGYVDLDNNWAIPPQFGAASGFIQGRALVFRESGWGVIDPQGRELIPCQYPSLTYRGGELYRTENSPDRGSNCWLQADGTTLQNAYLPQDIYCVNGYFALRNKYLDRDFQYATPGIFDWTGPIGTDGSGFVAMDGQLYRIQFED